MKLKKTTLSIVFALIGTLSGGNSSHAQFDALRKLGGGGKEVAKKKVACFRLKGALVETPVNMPPLFGGTKPESLKSVLERLSKARRDNDVVAVVLDLHNVRLGMAQLEELCTELRKFRVIDKDVFVHADSFNNRSYALASGASHVSIVPTGELWLTGIYGETPYLRGTLDLIGAVPDFLRCDH